MSVTGTTGTTGTTALDITAQKATGDFNMFLKLLAAQLKNQDPLNPAEGTEFTAQIATFSQLEQQIQSNKNLEALVKQNNYGSQSLAVSYIGKEALMPGGKISISDPVAGETEVTFGYKLNEAMRDTTIEIVNANGQVVSSVSGNKTAGVHMVDWDGFSENQALPNGEYTIRVKGTTVAEAVDSKGKPLGYGKPVTIQSYTYGVVKEVETYEGHSSIYAEDGRTVDFEDVLSVRRNS